MVFYDKPTAGSLFSASTFLLGGMGGSWIVKPPSARFPTATENESTMMALARTVGINVPRSELVKISDIRRLPENVVTIQGKALAVERFDCAGGGESIRMEDFA